MLVQAHPLSLPRSWRDDVCPCWKRILSFDSPANSASHDHLFCPIIATNLKSFQARTSAASLPSIFALKSNGESTAQPTSQEVGARKSVGTRKANQSSNSNSSIIAQLSENRTGARYARWFLLCSTLVHGQRWFPGALPGKT